MYVFNIGTTGTVHCVMLATMALYVRRSCFAYYRQDCGLAFALCSMLKVAGQWTMDHWTMDMSVS